jgi:undecaprenyl diphosphate synthase
MDGNGRWAQERGVHRIAGHRAGADNINRVVLGFAEYGIKYLTLYAFSTENWSRPKGEVRGLLHILSEVIDHEIEFFHQNGIRLCHLGRLDGLSQRLQRKVKHATELTKSNLRMTLNLAFNYGGRGEILDAVRRIVAEGVPQQGVNEALLSSYLYTKGLPDPDLIIRTGGEMRLSNFLIWQAAYSEYYSTPTLWPDFDKEEIESALIAYSQRERRFGGLKLRGGGGA